MLNLQAKISQDVFGFNVVDLVSRRIYIMIAAMLRLLPVFKTMVKLPNYNFSLTYQLTDLGNKISRFIWFQACRKGREDIVSLLLNYGADVKVTPNINPKAVAEYSPEFQVLLIRRTIDRYTER